MNTTSYRESHQNKGADYHATFSELPHRRLLWDLERRTLRRIVRRHATGEVRHLDFACGTGRVLGHLQPLVASSDGVDVSASMLAVAAQSAPGARLHHADITSSQVLAQRQFDLITAFRFFPNAEAALRRDAMRRLAGMLSVQGILVFNNHMNTSSLQRRLLALKGYRAEDGMSREEVRELVRECGLRIVARYPLGLLPLSDNLMVGPYALWSGAERAASALLRSEKLAQDIIYVCGRASS
jgi:predicted TPR repeat methyltransferase